MSDTSAVPSPPPRVRRQDRPSIELGDGEVLDPRVKFASNIGLSDDAVRDLNLPTVYIGAVAYVRRYESLKELSARAKRRSEPARHRRRAARA
jgi:hypothetical protein